MSPAIAGLAGIILLLLLMFINLPVGFAMGIVGVIGYCYIVSINAGLYMLSFEIWSSFSSYSLTVIPLFILMGQIAYYSGISKRLYDAAYMWIGHKRGGLAMATVGACAGFSTISGSTNATAATMAAVTIPEMKRFGYDMKLATGVVAAAGSLGILIPPSVIFIIYGILTEQSIGKLFAAGIIPGILLSLLFLLAIYITVLRKPELAPTAPKASLKECVSSLFGVIETIIIFILIMSGIFCGFFTPTEAAGVGAFLVLVLALIQKKISWRNFIAALSDTTKISCMIMVIVAGAMVFGKFIAVSEIPSNLAGWVAGLNVSKYVILTLILLVYFFGGCFMDSLAMIMLTIPIFYPLVISLGFDPIWFGVVVVMMTEIGVITPPVGINVYVVQAFAKDVPLEDIFIGVIPMLIAMLICTVLLVIFPELTTFLPELLSK